MTSNDDRRARMPRAYGCLEHGRNYAGRTDTGRCRRNANRFEPIVAALLTRRLVEKRGVS